MAYIKTLKDNELIGGTDNTDVYPVSTTQAIFSQKPDGTLPDGIKHQKLEDRLFDGEEDARELHRKSEMLVVRIANNQSNKDLQWTGNTYTMNLVGTAGLQTYGDEPEEPLSPNTEIDPHMASYELKVESSGAEVPTTVTLQDYSVNGTCNITTPGTYVATFTTTNHDGKQGTTKSATSTTYIVLDKYFGFLSTVPSNPELLSGSDYNHVVAETITLPVNASGEQFKHVYIAIPKNLLPDGKTIEVKQPDALNAPFKMHELNTITRQGFTYRLFESGTDATSEDGFIDSTVIKRLTINVK